MPIVECMPGLAQSAEQIARDKDHAKQQQAFVKPTGQASFEGGGI